MDLHLYFMGAGIIAVILVALFVVPFMAARIGTLLIEKTEQNSFPRLTLWSVFAGLLLFAIAFISPQQLPVVLYKLALVIIGGVLGYWLDRALFPYARPHLQQNCANALAQSYACLRRALIVIACVLGLTMGL